MMPRRWSEGSLPVGLHAATSCRLIRSTTQRVRHDVHSNDQKLLGPGGARCGVQKARPGYSESKHHQDSSSLAVNAETPETLRSAVGSATGRVWATRPEPLSVVHSWDEVR